MKCIPFVPVIAAWLLGSSVAAATETVSIKVSVRLRDKVADQLGKPFAEVGGFVVKRVAADYKGASCPNASNARGELDCKVSCDTTDADLQLLMHPPTKEKARIVAGLTPPPAKSIEIVGCKLSSKAPVVLVYRTLDVTLDELFAANPELVAATADKTDTVLRFKPFSLSAPRLQQLAAKPSNREALLDLGRAAQAWQDLPEDKRQLTLPSADFGQYAIGVNSVVLQATVNDTIGPAAARRIKVSADATDFHRSVRDVEQVLDAKPVLSDTEIILSSEVRQLKKEPRLASDKLMAIQATMKK